MKTPYIIALIIIAMTLAGAADASEGAVRQGQQLAAASSAVLDQAAYAEGLHAAEHVPNETLRAGGVNVPILVYHIVRPGYPTDSLAVRALAQTPEVFDQEMAHLQDAGYQVITFARLEEYLTSLTPLPNKPIVLSFDDGWRDQFVYAFPILQKYQYPATFFIFTNSIGHRDFMTLENLKALIASGMTIGDHSRSHPYLTRIASEAKLEDEIVTSKALLEQELGVPVHEFAYPFGAHNASTTAVVEAAGFRSARGDYYTGAQSLANLYELSALNAPTTIEEFDRRFP